jgi:hypothetical protein
VLKERASKIVLPQDRLEDCIELALGFLSNHWNFYQNGGFHERRAVLKLAFAGASPLWAKWSVWNTEILIPFPVLVGKVQTGR